MGSQFTNIRPIRHIGHIGLIAAALLLRWITYPSPLPTGWVRGTPVTITAPIMEEPEHTDTKTIIRAGIWELQLPGYAVITPGDRVRFSGTPEPTVIAGKVTKIVMMDPTFEGMSHTRCVGAFHTGCVAVWLSRFREYCVAVLEKNLPEPMASLAAGILLGVKAQLPADFYQALASTGTTHIIAASGYNVSVVLGVISKALLYMVSRGWATALGLVGVFLYILVAGAGASVIRAGVMGGLTVLAYAWGRPTEAKRLLWVTIVSMLFANPLYLVDPGFQLSAAATWGLLYLDPMIQRIFNNQFLIFNQFSNNQFLKSFQSILADYFYPTLAATVATLPVILWWFGRVSVVSLLVNMLVLPLIPLAMALAAVAVLIPIPGALLAYVPLAWMVSVISLFGK